MNERIRQLVEQAGGEFYEGFAGGTNFVKFAEDDFEKFAELIVGECVKLCEGEAIVAGTNGRKDAVASNCATTIKQHFGVEL